MSNSRRSDVSITFQGVDISDDIRDYLLSITYTDNEEGEADDLQIVFHDRDDIWMSEWLNDMLEAAASSGAPTPPSTSTDWSIGDPVTANGLPQYTSYGEGKPGDSVTNYSGTVTFLNLKSSIPYPIHVSALGWFALNQVTKGAAGSNGTGQSVTPKLSLEASIIRENWNDDSGDVLSCGKFELDAVNASDPAGTITIKSVSLPFSAPIRQTKISKAWESSTLSQIAKEKATANGMDCMYLSKTDPAYKHIEQNSESDSKFLSKLCKDAGISFKVTNQTLVFFDQTEYEAKDPIMEIERGDGSYISANLSIGTADTQYSSCRVSYVNPSTGVVVEATAYAEGHDEKEKASQCLQVTAKVSSVGEALALAGKRLRLHNKFGKTVTFSFWGIPDLMAGCTIRLLDGWGVWAGKYIISQSVHSVGESGYTTKIRARRVLEGY